jgi:hypothetical protein
MHIDAEKPARPRASEIVVQVVTRGSDNQAWNLEIRSIGVAGEANAK